MSSSSSSSWVILAAVALSMVSCLICVQAFRPPRVQTVPQSHQVLFYDYFKKGPEKKEIGRLWKNIIFPGIYVEYADTKEVKKTIKIETKAPKYQSRNEGDSFYSGGTKGGSYNVVDEKSAPKIISATSIKDTLKPVAKPADFKAPVPKKAITVPLGTGISVLPSIASYPRPKKPIVIYESEASSDCKKVREACSMLDLVVEYRPCPGARAGFSDTMCTITNGKRTIPFMVDVNPSMYKPQLIGAKDIIDHLFNTYGPGADKIPNSLKGFKGGVLGGGGSGKGSKLRANARTDITRLKPITLYGWEGAQYVKTVRETLSELGLAHIFVNVANGSQNR